MHCDVEETLLSKNNMIATRIEIEPILMSMNQTQQPFLFVPDNTRRFRFDVVAWS